MLKCCEPLFEVCADGECVFLKFLFINHFQNCSPCCTAYWVPSECIEITPSHQNLGYFYGCYHCPHWDSIPNSLQIIIFNYIG
ncbi:hypothetical protein IC582_009681 [Cucumis melo]